MGAILLAVLLAADAPTWEKQIAPLFAKHCNGCHAASVTMGSLDLETYEGVRKGGNHGTIVVPGKPDESRLYTMLTGKHAPAMPMDGKVLAPELVALVADWISAGAAGPSLQQVYSLAWHPGGAFHATGGYGKVTFSDGAREWTGFSGPVRAIAYAADGGMIATVDGGGIKVWDAVTRSELRTLRTGETVCSLAFSADGKLLVIDRLDGTRETYALDGGN